MELLSPQDVEREPLPLSVGCAAQPPPQATGRKTGPGGTNLALGNSGNSASTWWPRSTSRHVDNLQLPSDVMKMVPYLSSSSQKSHKNKAYREEKNKTWAKFQSRNVSNCHKTSHQGSGWNTVDTFLSAEVGEPLKLEFSIQPKPHCNCEHEIKTYNHCLQLPL